MIKIKFLILIFLISLKCYAQLPVLHTGFPKVLDTVSQGSSIINIPLIADLNRDGTKEIITIIPVNSNTCNLFVIKNDGSIQQGFPKQFNSYQISSAAGDVDGDGFIDIVLRDQNYLYAINRFGNELPGFPVYYPITNNVPDVFIALYNFDNDSKLELITGAYRQLAVFNSNGQMRMGWPKQIIGNSAIGPAIGDLESDGNAEIIISSHKVNPVDSGMVYILRKDGSNFPNWPVHMDPGFFSEQASPSLYINSNHIDSTFIYITADSGNVLNRLIKYNIYGQIIAQTTITAPDVFGTAVIGDINGDGKVEIATGTAYGYSTYLFTDNLIPLPGWPQEGSGTDFWQITIGKLTNGNNLNLISNSNYGDYNFGFVYCYNFNATQLSFSPIRPFSLTTGVSFADIDNDGSVEMITTGQTINRFYLGVYTFPGISYTNANFPWPTFGHDRYRTNQYGFIPPDETIGIQPISGIVPKKFKLYQNYPNPFNPSTKIKFDLPKENFVSLKVYDILGREIAKLVNETLHSGEYEISFDGSNFASGIYFVKLESYDKDNPNILNQNVIKLSLIK